MGTYTPSPLGTLANEQAAVAKINENLEDIADVLKDKLDRIDGLPNEMQRDLDMNSNHIVNVADPVADGDAVNLRTLRNLGGGPVSTDHGQLTGLEDDDHPQYLTQARGDARYATPAQVAVAVDGISLTDLLTVTDLAVGDIPKWNGAAWVNAPDGGGTGGGATDLSVSTNAFTVTINSSTGLDATITEATALSAGIMSQAQAAKLSGIASGATANSPDAVLLDRSNHTGTQLASTISDFAEAVEDTIGTKVVGGTAIGVTYNDVTGTTTIAYTGGSGGGGATILNELTDVTITTPANNHALMWDSATSQWINRFMTTDRLVDVIPSTRFGGMTLIYDADDSAFRYQYQLLSNLGDVSIDYHLNYDGGPNPGDVLVWSNDIVGGTVWKNMKPRRPVQTITGATVQPMLTLNGFILRCTNAGGTTVTLTRGDVNEDNGFGITNSLPGHAVWIYQDQSAGITFNAAAGVTIRYAPGAAAVSNQQYQLIECIRLSTTEWLVRPGGSSGAVSSAPTVVSVDTLAAMKALALLDNGAIVMTRGYSAVGDGGASIYRYDSAGTGTSNDFNIVTPAVLPGRFFIVQDASGVRSEQAGVFGNNTNESARINILLTNAEGPVYFYGTPSRIFKGLDLSPKNNQTVIGVNKPRFEFWAATGAASGALFDLRNRTYVTLKGLYFVGATSNTYHAVVHRDLPGDAETVSGILVEDCEFVNSWGIALAIGGKGSTIRKCVFTNYALRNQSSYSASAPAILVYDNQQPATYRFGRDVTIEDCSFNGGFWSGIYLNGRRCKVHRCSFRNTWESAIFVSQFAEDLVISDNIIDTTTMRNISGGGVEYGGLRGTITGNVIKNCAHAGVSIQNCRQTSVTGNTISGCRDGLWLISSDSSAPIEDNVLTGNNIRNCQHGLRFSRYTSGATIKTAKVVNNVVQDSSTAAFFTDGTSPQLESASCVIKDNLGVANTTRSPVVVRVAANTTTGTQTITGVGYKASAVLIEAGDSSSTIERGSRVSVDTAATVRGYFWANDATNNRKGLTSNAWEVVSGGGTVQHAASFTAFTDDGCTVNVTTTAGSFAPWITFTFLP